MRLDSLTCSDARNDPGDEEHGSTDGTSLWAAIRQLLSGDCTLLR